MDESAQDCGTVPKVKQNEETKRCAKCERDKPLDGFHKHPTSTTGRQSWCKACAAARKAESRKRTCRACHILKPRAEFVLVSPVSGGRKLLTCHTCAQGIDAERVDVESERKARQEAARKRKRLDFERPRCVDCGDRQPRSGYEARDGNRVSKVCTGCREARALTVEVARMTTSPPTYGTGRDPRPHSAEELRRREAVAKRKNARSFAALRANRAEVMGA